MVSIPACHAGNPGSIPGLGAFLNASHFGFFSHEIVLFLISSAFFGDFFCFWFPPFFSHDYVSKCTNFSEDSAWTHKLLWPLDLQSNALPTELSQHACFKVRKFFATGQSFCLLNKLQKGSTGTWTRITRIKTLGANQLHYRTQQRKVYSRQRPYKCCGCCKNSFRRVNFLVLFRMLGFDHINRNAPVLIRTPKLTRFEPAQYWGGGPPGNSVVLNPFFFLSKDKRTFSQLFPSFRICKKATFRLLSVLYP